MTSDSPCRSRVTWLAIGLVAEVLVVVGILGFNASSLGVTVTHLRAVGTQRTGDFAALEAQRARVEQASATSGAMR